MTLKELIQGNSNFQYYRDSTLWYSTENGNFLFSDIGNATFSHTEKSLLMMRYIRKHLNTINMEGQAVG